MEEISDDLKWSVESSDEEFEGTQGVNYKKKYSLIYRINDIRILIQNMIFCFLID